VVSTSSTDGVWLDRRAAVGLLVDADSVLVGDDLDPGANHGRGRAE
jgi:hypothetical protein